MRGILIILFSWVLVFSGKAQENFLEFQPGWRGVYVYETDDSYEVAGLNSSSSFQNYFQFSSVDFSGVPISESTFDLDSVQSLDLRFRSFFASSISGHHCAGQLLANNDSLYGTYFRFNESLNDTLYSLPPFQLGLSTTFRYIRELTPDSLLILGTFQTTLFQSEVLILCMDTLGNFHWQNNIDFPGEDVFPVDIHPHPAGGYVLTAQEYTGLGGSGMDDEIHSVLYRLDELGNVVWSRRPGSDEEYWTEPGGSIILNNGEIMTFWTENKFIEDGIDDYVDEGSIYFQTYLEDGTSVSNSNYFGSIETGIDGFQFYIYSIHQVQIWPDGNIVINGSNFREGFLMKVSPEGEYLWHQTYSPIDDIPAEHQGTKMPIYGIYPASDGGFLGTGEFRANPGTDYPEGIQTSFLLKVDSLGCLEPEDCDIVDNIWEWEAEKPIGNLKVYPNPASDDILIEIPTEIEAYQEIGLELIDVSGRKILNQIILRSELDGDKMSLALNDYPTGIYYVRLLGSESIWSSSFVKE